MATNVSLDTELIDEALRIGGKCAKEGCGDPCAGAIRRAAQAERFLDLLGKLEWDSSFDYKAAEHCALKAWKLLR